MVGKYKVSHMHWDIAGSYYIQTRNGKSPQAVDEPWGLLNYDWSKVRSPVTVENSLTKMIDALK